MLGSTRTVWVPKELKSLKSIMKPTDLHLIVNPVSDLVKVFDVKGTLVFQATITCGMGSRGERYPGCKVWQVVPQGTTDPGSDDPNRRLVWMTQSGDFGNNNNEGARFYFAPPDFTSSSAEQTMHCHFWMLSKSSFVALWNLVVETTKFRGGIVFAELAFKAMLDQAATAPHFDGSYRARN